MYTTLIRSGLLYTVIATCCMAVDTSWISIRDVVYQPDGTAFTGTLVVEPAEDSSRTPAFAFPIEDGMLCVRIPLDINAAKRLYLATYKSRNGRSEWKETWRVPLGKSDLSLREVRVGESGRSGERNDATTAVMPTKDIPVPIPISGISGLNIALSQINTELATVTSEINSLSIAAQTAGSTVRIYAETPSGAIDGVNSSFALANQPLQPNALRVFKNGQRLVAGTDYSVSGKTIVVSNNSIPVPGDTIAADYTTTSAMKRLIVPTRDIKLPIPISDVSGLNVALSQLNTSLSSLSTIIGADTSELNAINVNNVVGETPQGLINGTNATFTLANIPSGNGPILYKNGMRQQAGVDYVIAGQTITFTPLCVPQSGDSLLADYLF